PRDRTARSMRRRSCMRRFVTRRSRRQLNPLRPELESLEDRRLLSAYIRVNQVGYLSTEPKQAVLLASGTETGATFQVLDSSGHTIYSAPIGANLGGWSGAFPDAYRLDFSPVSTPGTYSLAVTGPIAASSPRFAVGTGTAMYAGLLS